MASLKDALLCAHDRMPNIIIIGSYHYFYDSKTTKLAAQGGGGGACAAFSSGARPYLRLRILKTKR